MNRFINNTIKKVSMVKGERKKIFSGKVSRYDGNTIECSGFPATIGTLCKVLTDDGNSAEFPSSVKTLQSVPIVAGKPLHSIVFPSYLLTFPENIFFLSPLTIETFLMVLFINLFIFFICVLINYIFCFSSFTLICMLVFGTEDQHTDKSETAETENIINQNTNKENE